MGLNNSKAAGDPRGDTKWADQAYQDRGGGDAGDSAYNEIMSKPVRERHTMYKVLRNAQPALPISAQASVNAGHSPKKLKAARIGSTPQVCVSLEHVYGQDGVFRQGKCIKWEDRAMSPSKGMAPVRMRFTGENA